MGTMDLHIHTSASDGEYTAYEIERELKEKGAEAFAITDHDTVAGISTFSPKTDLLWIPGVEVSAVDKKLPKESRMHILGYEIDMHEPSFEKFMLSLKDRSIHSITEKWTYLRMHFAQELSLIPEREFENILLKDANIGAPDLAVLLMKYQVVFSVEEAFDRYLDEAHTATKLTKKSTTIEETLEQIISAHGIPVVAHAITILSDLKELKKYLLYLKTLGMRGVEVQHVRHSEEVRRFLRQFSVENDLLESGGTDFHGLSVKPKVKLLTGVSDNICVRESSLVEEVKRRRS